MDTEIDDVVDALARNNISLSLEGDMARIDVDGHTIERRWTRSADYLPGPPPRPAPALVLGTQLAPRLVAAIRSSGDWFADGRGNAYISAPGVRVDIRNQRPSGAPTGAKATNLVSARRAQVIFCLLSWPGMLRAPIRSLAAFAGVSPAIASETRRALAREGYLHPGAARLDRFDELLDRWADAFPLGLGQDLTLGLFTGEPDPSAWTQAGVPLYVSGESAVPSIRGTTLTMYVPELVPQAIAASRWRRPAGDEQPTVTLRRTFWRDPLRQGEMGGTVQDAPPLLVYADLLASREPRQRETALAMRGALSDGS